MDLYLFLKKVKKGRIGKLMRHRAFNMAAAVVVFVTTYMLILPAITQTGTTYCGKEEHKHADACYSEEKILICEIAESTGHTHTDECVEYTEELICSIEESSGHQHDDGCYETESVLICTSEDPEHEHDSSCYETEKHLICSKQESEGHTHSADCYEKKGKLVCGLEETQGHTHGDDCYKVEKTLTCKKQEHTHETACFANPNADKENKSDWDKTVKRVKLTGNWATDTLAVAETQLGYKESTTNYIVDEKGKKKGYTRYGDWYGNAYGDWCAMYASFCISQAKVPTTVSAAVRDDNGVKVYMPISASCQRWIEMLNRKETPYYYAVNDQNTYTLINDSSNFKPSVGNLIFFNWDSQPDADHVGLIIDVKKNSDGKITEIQTIEGNSSNKVKKNTYKPNNKKIMGYAVIPQNPKDPNPEDLKEVAVQIADDESASKPNSETTTETPEEPETEAAETETTTDVAEESAAGEDGLITKTFEGDDYTITVSYTAEAMLPENVILVAEELTGLDYENKLVEAQEAMNLDVVSFARFFEISFFSYDEEIEPQAPVSIVINYKDPIDVGTDDIGNAVHFTEDGPEVLEIETVDETDGTTSISFEQESFSVTGTVYGVALLAEDGIDAQADNGWSDPPAVGNLTGKVVQEPVVGEWYILYGYNGSGNAYALPESWPNRGPSNQYGQDPCPTLSQASTQVGGTVKYTGNQDMAWQYVGDSGFVNRHGYYLRVQTNAYRNDDGSVYANYINFTVSTNAPTSAGTNNVFPVYYSWDGKSLYSKTKRVDHVTTLRITNQGYSDEADFNLTSNSYAHASSSLDMYIAQVTNTGQIEGGHNNHPPTSVTGDVSYMKPIIYNIDGSGTTAHGVAGVEYTITNKRTGASFTVTSGSDISVYLHDMPQGTYIVEQTKVPDGYILSPQTKEFDVDDKGQGHPGIFYLYKDSDFGADKTGQVIDYINRIYQIQLSAKSGKYQFVFDPVHIDIIVDQSNSMLFPQQLTPVPGGTVRLGREGSVNGQTNDQRIDRLVNNGTLRKDQTYYLVTDNEGDTATSTVYAIFYDGSGWCYQDASYYSKAYRHWVLGDEVNVIENNNYVQFAQSDEAYVGAKHGGSISQVLKDKFENDLGSSGNNWKEYQLFTGSQYNRLHELQQSVLVIAGLIGNMNDNSQMTIETFAKDVYGCDTYTLNNAGIKQVYNAVNNITTRGGTRQDLALRHFYGDYQTGEIDSAASSTSANHKHNHLTNYRDYVVLITDGAPNFTAAAGQPNSIQQVVNAASTLKGQMSADDKLITVGLGAGNVGGDMLPDSCTQPSSIYYKRVEQSGDLVDYIMTLFTAELMRDKKQIGAEGDILDVVSDSFYITDRNGNALSAGTRIDLEGNPTANGPGLVCYGPITTANPNYNPDEEDSSPTITQDEWYVKWDDQTLGTGTTTSGTTTQYVYRDDNGTETVLDPNVTYYINYNNGRSISGSGSYDTTRDKLVFRNGGWIYHWRDMNGETDRTGSVGNRVTTRQVPGNTVSPSWTGKVYLKAKEDFIGGNTIDTNKDAKVTLKDGQITGQDGLHLPTPTVNVRLLPMEGFESEETVFLGDDVTDIRDKIQTLLEKTVVKKIKSSTGNQMNYKEGATEANGCYENYFTIPYAIRDLTEDEWNTLINGGTVKIDYTYDDASSHGAVGYFEFSLKKEVVEGEPSSYNNHETAKTGEDVEKYTLTVTYTAYKKGESDKNNHKRGDNVHNGSNGPGTEVGTGSDIPYGKGTESVDEIHHVHVIDGEIFLTKVLDESLVDTSNDQTFTFELYKKDSESGEAVGDAIKAVTVTIPAGSTEGTIKISDLARNNYIVKESASDDFVVQKVEVVNGDTNCDYQTSMPSLEFDIGTNINSWGNNPDHNVIIFNQTLPTYEDSMWEDEERYVYSKPFEKPGIGTTGSGQGSGTSGSNTTTDPGTHKETITVTDYAWDSGTIISQTNSGNQYEKLTSSKELLDMNHTSYGILTQSATNKDSWTVEWHTWTSNDVPSTSTGSISYQPVTVKYFMNNQPSLNQYANGSYYYRNGSDYEVITGMTIVYGGWGISIVTSSGEHIIQNQNGLQQGYDNEVGDSYVWYDIYQRVTTGGGNTSTKEWSVDIKTEPADISKIPTVTRTEEIDVPDEPGSGNTDTPAGTPVESVSSDKLSVGHGVITNKKAKYTADIQVQKKWQDNGAHTGEDVYVILIDPSGAPVKNAEQNTMMLRLNAANKWKGTFTISVTTQNYNPLANGYSIREVSRLENASFTDSISATQVNDANDTAIYYVTTASENDVVIISGKAYNVHYQNIGDRMLIATNNSAYELPHTGGTGTTPYTMGGASLVLLALVLYGFSLRRRRERRLR